MNFRISLITVLRCIFYRIYSYFRRNLQYKNFYELYTKFLIIYLYLGYKLYKSDEMYLFKIGNIYFG